MTDLGLRFSIGDWERIERDWSAWWAHALDRPLVVIETDDDGTDHTDADLDNLLLDVPVEVILQRREETLRHQRWHGDAWPRWFVQGGPGSMAGFLGAPVSVQRAEGTIWFGELGLDSLADLQLAYDAANPYWLRIQRLTRAAVARWGSQVSVSHTSLGASYDIVAALRGSSRLLTDLYDAPEHVERLGDEVTRLWQSYYDGLYEIIRPAGRGTTPWAPIWSPGRCCMIGCDFCYMISPAMFERFVAPGLQQCFAHLDHAFYHLDGQGEVKHLPRFLAMPELAGIQWIPGDGAPPPEEWVPLLRRIRDGGKLCQVFVSARGALAIVQAMGGQGFIFKISDRMTSGEAESFLKRLQQEEGYRRPLPV